MSQKTTKQKIETLSVAVAYKDLQSAQCQCGRKKKPGKSVCYRCWQQLPRRMQSALCRRDGYVESYSEAVAWLQKHEVSP